MFHCFTPRRMKHETDEMCSDNKGGFMNKVIKNVKWEECEFLKLKNAVGELAVTMNMDTIEIQINEHTETYKAFGKTYGKDASELFKHFLYSGEDLRLSFIATVVRARECKKDMEEAEFWEDTSIIISLVEALDDWFRPLKLVN